MSESERGGGSNIQFIFLAKITYEFACLCLFQSYSLVKQYPPGQYTQRVEPTHPGLDYPHKLAYVGQCSQFSLFFEHVGGEDYFHQFGHSDSQ